MTEKQIRQAVVNIVEGWVGLKEADGSFQKILDIYNNHFPRARNHKMLPTEEWCAATVSAAFIQAGLTDIAPTECSCSKMIELYKAMGRWKEDDAYTPEPGDIIMYDWGDTGNGDNLGAPDHTGIVTTVSGGLIHVVEGNKGESVARRYISVNGRYIRGYCLPDYASKADPIKLNLPVLRKGSKGSAVAVLQAMLTARGADTKGVDGSFGPNTDKALRAYQSAHGLAVDGSCGPATWGSIRAETGKKRVSGVYNGVHISVVPAANFNLFLWDQRKKLLGKNKCNAGFFGKYGAEEYTLPVGHFVGLYKAISENTRRSCEERGQFEGSRYRFDSGSFDYFNNLYGNAVSTLVVDNNGARIKDLIHAPRFDECKCAISGIPIMRDGQDVKFDPYVIGQGWNASPLYNTLHIFYGVLEPGGKDIVVVEMETKTKNMVTSAEAYRAFKAMGLYDVIKMDGGGSLYYNAGGKTKSTLENRRICTGTDLG